MSSEFDLSFETFFRDVFDIDMASGDSNSNDTQHQHHFDDKSQAPDTASREFYPINDEALQQPNLDDTGAAALWMSELAPSSLEETPNLHKTGFDIDESEYEYSSLSAKPLQPMKPSRCPWTACSSSPPLETMDETKAHFEEHWKDLSKQWSGASKCSWPKCPSKATFKSPNAWKTHVYNIHVDPLVCTVPQCSHTKPFGKGNDLDRHIMTAHEEVRNHMCPIDSCEANTTGFARKDKLLKHIREQHEILRCPYNHCAATVLKTQEESHLQQFHGSWECAIGACERGIKSCFLEGSLKRHIRKHHGLTWDPIHTMLGRMGEAKDGTARSAYLTSPETLRDCMICSTQQHDGRP